ncbi:uncharacterized protein LOC130368654 isoform X2 [Hyla sarda]|uniref:uncharacterized protein LOC130368654 isoform X2 n=1 Tax=Hyla sarda TaxID=327740 RepID=UPI0024C307A9|nr:uncharacterized protein LOC130368654 isoform X2 [Hyla sarda]
MRQHCRKPSDDRGRKKMEKLLNQARQDIAQLTDQLLHTQEDLTLKDRQMKDLQKLNEMRLMEIHHVKSQMEVTKKSLQILQEETTIQCSLLESEIRRKTEQLEMLENDKALKKEQLVNSTSQWEITDCMLSNSNDDITAISKEQNLLEDYMEAAKETPPKNISAPSQTPVADKDNLVHTLSNVEELNSASHQLSASNVCLTPPPDLPILQTDAAHQRVNEGSLSNFASSSVVPHEHESLLSMTNKNDESAISQPNSEEITNSDDVSFPLPSNGSDTTALDSEIDHEIYAISSSERYNSPISNKTERFTQANNGGIIHLNANKMPRPTIPLKPDEDLNTMASTHIHNTNTDVNELNNITYRSQPAATITEAPLTAFDNTFTTSVSEPKQDASGSISVSLPAKKTDNLASETKTPFTEAPKTRSIPCMSSGYGHQSSEPHTLRDTLLETEHQTRQEEETTVEASDSGDGHTELWWLSERLHKCVREIRNLLITEGFHSLADVFAEEVQDKSEALSTNLTQVENFPTVLQRLLHNITMRNAEDQELTNDHSPDSVIRKEEDRNKIDSFLPQHNEEESQKCNGVPMKTHLSNDFGHTSSFLFAHTDEEHIRQEMQKACLQGRIPVHICQDISKLMAKYRILCQEKLQSLVWGYVQYISWNRAENLLRRQCLNRPQITPILYKLQKQKDQAYLQWRDKILQSQEQRLRLSAVLNQTLQRVHEDTGILLIKPLISWAGSSELETRKQVNCSKKTFRHACFPPVCQHGLSCHGISPNHVTKTWKNMHIHTELRPLVVTPKLLEMDIHRYLCRECCVMSQLRRSLHQFSLNQPSNLVNIKRTATFPAL